MGKHNKAPLKRRRSRSSSVSGPPAKIIRPDDTTAPPALAEISENARAMRMPAFAPAPAPAQPRNVVTPQPSSSSRRFSISPTMTSPPSVEELGHGPSTENSMMFIFSDDLKPLFDGSQGRLGLNHDLTEDDWREDMKQQMRHIAHSIYFLADRHGIEEGWAVFPARLRNAEREAVVIVLVFPQCSLVSPLIFGNMSFVMYRGAINSQNGVSLHPLRTYQEEPALGSSIGLASLADHGTGSLGGFLEDPEEDSATYIMTAGHVGQGKLDTDEKGQAPDTAILQQSNEDHMKREKELEGSIRVQEAAVAGYEERIAARRTMLGGQDDRAIERLERYTTQLRGRLQDLKATLARHQDRRPNAQRYLGTVAHAFRAPVSFGSEYNTVASIEDPTLTNDVRLGYRTGSVALEQESLTMDWALVRAIRTGINVVHDFAIDHVGPLLPGATVCKAGRTTGVTTGTVLRYRVYACMKGNYIFDGHGGRRRVITREFAVGSNEDYSRKAFSDVGDSGSWVAMGDEATGTASVCAMIIGGTPLNALIDLTIVTPMHKILADIEQRTGKKLVVLGHK
ncbi:MAG: hypothetical protein M1819_005750 [Sarea resinae]|nr:MAG: hypothetical protein M1819_005750 [Sarea resinae]